MLEIDKGNSPTFRSFAKENGWLLLKQEGIWATGLKPDRLVAWRVTWITKEGLIVEAKLEPDLQG